LVGADKTYLATIRLGVSTVSDDSQSEVLETASQEALAAIENAQIQQEIEKLTGVIQQRPSSVSAIKVDGKRAYDLVRSGEEVELKSREVTVSTFELVSSSISSKGFIDLEVKVDCSSGTYIRALARDLGQALGVGGHITALRRTRVGSFDVAEANQITDLENLSLDPTCRSCQRFVSNHQSQLTSRSLT
jgi:tRNA pseudouridine55 synthase